MRKLARDITRVLFTTFGFLFASCLLASRVHAVEEIELHWDAPEGCPDRAEIAQQITAQLGRELRDVEAPLRAAARLKRTDTGYVLALQTTLGESRGTRTFRGPTCAEVADAAILVIALSLDEAQAEREEARRARATPKVLPASDDGRSRTRFLLRAGALFEAGFLPRPSFGAEGALGLSIGRSRIELSGLWLPPVQSERAREGGRVEVSLWTARAGYCQQIFGERNRIGGCLGVELGQSTAQGHELTEVARRTALWSAGVISLRLWSQLHERIGLMLEPALAVAFTRRRFVSSGPQDERVSTLHTPKPLSKRLSLGLELFF